MTISRSEKIAAGDIDVAYVTGSEPDTIGMEFLVEGNALFEMQMGADGVINLIFDEIENAEISLGDLQSLFDRGAKELTEWYRRVDWLVDDDGSVQ